MITQENQRSSFFDDIEVPAGLTNELFAPLLVPGKKITDLSTDSLRLICGNLDYDSFVKFTSTCHELNRMTEDVVVMRKVCGRENTNATIGQCIEQVRNTKREEKQEKERRRRERKHRLDKAKEESIFCCRRLHSNVLSEGIALVFLFVFLLLFPLQLDRFINIGKPILALILLPVALYYFVSPYILWFFGLFTFYSDGVEEGNRESKIYGGSWDYFNQLMLWSNQGGFRIVKFFLGFITYILFIFYCYDLMSFGYVLLPLLLYTGLYPCFGSINCNPCMRSDCECSCSFWRCSVMLPFYGLIFVGLLLCMLRSFDVISNFFTLCILPISFAFLLFPTLLCFKCCMNVLDTDFCCSDNTWSCYDDPEEDEVLTTCLWEIGSCITFPVIVVFFTLLSVLLDGYVDWYFTPLFTMVWICFFFYTIFVQITTCLINSIYTNSCLCCPKIVPDSWKFVQMYICCEVFEDDVPFDNLCDNCCDPIIDCCEDCCEPILDCWDDCCDNCCDNRFMDWCDDCYEDCCDNCCDNRFMDWCCDCWDDCCDNC
ncbi:F-box domain-containing protein [Entamoeba marina]